MTKNLVIYHDKCMDGFAAAWAVNQFLIPQETKYIPCNYGTVPEINSGLESIYVVDFSFSREVLTEMCRFADQVVILDHHKTAQEALTDWNDKPENLYIEFDMNRSGAGITWDYFSHSSTGQTHRPPLLNYVEDRDLWRFDLSSSKAINAFIAQVDKSFPAYDALSNALRWEFANCVQVGEYLLKQHQSICEEIAKDARQIEITSNTGVLHVGLAANCTGQFASEVGNILALRSGTFGATYYSSKNGSVKWSLRSCEDYDVSKIAQCFGGGGHKNAAGFVLKEESQMYSETMSLWSKAT